MTLEITDFLKPLDAIKEWQTRRIGAQEMQQAVLQWAVARREILQGMMLSESLIAVMEAQIALVDAEKPIR